ncbi:uncharacterized protein LOC129567398 [Sitodiplosis mosellana]|uniref:uncharacterized protein LOC129567398 n=1 Tax=Sitodiplosis mosellana TaxID=263140 RepID=UPI002444E680|nr:uncharacterized protein LOC129567398 [Sitodiplosis mosellana]
MKHLILVILVITDTLVLAIPLPQAPAAAAPGAQPNNLPLSLLMNSMPRSGIVGMADNLGAGLANFGNGQGSAFDAIVSGIFNAFGNFISGVLGSGAINTGFLNYNNRPPADAGAATQAPAGGAATPAPAAEK